MKVDPAKLLAAVCPSNAQLTSHPSSRLIGTAYGRWLGVQYMRELEREGKPETYGIVDFEVYSGSVCWEQGNIWSLDKIDPGVYGAFLTTEWTRGARKRPDILNADTSEVFEIKPKRSRDEGPSQLKDYIDTLNRLAPRTSPVFGPPRDRTWEGGDWDPTRYPLIIPNFSGARQLCVIHADMDKDVQGLIVYDIKCCTVPDLEDATLQPTAVRWMVPEIEDQMRPKLEQDVGLVLPHAEAGARYAVLTSETFFEVFVKPAWDRKMDRIHERYGPQPGPVLKKFMLETMVLQHVLTSGLGTALVVASGWLPREQADRFMNLTLKQWALGAAGGVAIAIGGVMLSAPALNAAVAAGVPVTTGTGLTAGTVATLTTGTTVAANLAPRVATQLPRVAPRLVNGSSRLYHLGQAASRGIGSGPGGMPPPGIGSGPGASAGLGVLGAIIYVAMPAEAAGATPGSPQAQAEVVGSELPLLVPVELLEPVGSKTVGAGSFVRLGEEKFFVPAIVTADDE